MSIELSITVPPIVSLLLNLVCYVVYTLIVIAYAFAVYGCVKAGKKPKAVVMSLAATVIWLTALIWIYSAFVWLKVLLGE